MATCTEDDAACNVVPWGSVMDSSWMYADNWSHHPWDAKHTATTAHDIQHGQGAHNAHTALNEEWVFDDNKQLQQHTSQPHEPAAHNDQQHPWPLQQAPHLAQHPHTAAWPLQQAHSAQHHPHPTSLLTIPLHGRRVYEEKEALKRLLIREWEVAKRKRRRNR